MKKISNWVLAAWLALIGYLQVWPGALNDAWMMLPEDLKQYIPPVAAKVISFALFAGTFLAKMHVMRVSNVKLKQAADDQGGGDGRNS